ncbi:MAG: hypothetical protein R2699_10550 [Acidimicrobiales bacterium]
MLDAPVVSQAYTLDVAVRADAGDVVAVLGPNGAEVDVARRARRARGDRRGHVVVDGATLDDPVRERPHPAERQRVPRPRDLVLFTHLDARANVAFGLRAGSTGAAPALRRAGLARPSGRR